MSMELWNELQALKERVAALEQHAVDKGEAHYVARGPEAPRRKPGPPKGYKRQPRQVAPNG